MDQPRRYLTSFRGKQNLHQFTDILIIGGGIAGLRAALEVPPTMEALVITKEHIRESNSAYAQGGIAGVLSPEDRFENHIEDTHAAGAGLCDPEVVDLVVREAPAQIHDLVRWGTIFDLEDGHLALTREGGHSHRRIVHALGDATGQEMMRAIIARVKQAPNISVWDSTFTIDLLTMDGACVGAVVSRAGAKVLIWAKQVILAAGGCGMVYRETTNPPVATGDGMAAAYRAGAELRDMEFMQFHPTVLYVAGSARYLISEAVRGEGAYLRDVNGERFMLAEDKRAELLPRDIVSQAIFRCMERTQHPNVYLDLTHLDPVRVRERFPGINRVCRNFGLDITKDRIPVRPGAHYMIGGVTVDTHGATTIPNLWAAGEVTSSGLHGANRLASNSLLEGLVYGAICARNAIAAAKTMPTQMIAHPIQCKIDPDLPVEDIDVEDVTNSLRSLMVRKMGIVRDRARLEEAKRDVNFWCRYVLPREFQHRQGWELQNLLILARLMIDAAIRREESRGTHYRSDFPARNDSQWGNRLPSPLVKDLRF
ncbi:L-aspartate oxidase [Tuwongella immobilis]|uniref:L-aspartate oxidase n=1 Tax=Tuwongella immobilis TaxID=692036 RepID=A0A6C2YTA4_9BACT|nr:L-aspartate oxidase [Tuwongella immobilis]VIP04112.1 l-aspartate oxidase : L-aspartate oxidase OS=Blastopirellula marina DSM 3645 GN=DSM3645_21574 PE=4 SV=1: FAD_binding_2: Succ_DH_flav_C [Tuwongella immobilis]VTS05591.1 l-aspartate oxidase : L-aspartate oxidase OS=Blastopirellula marina DSM 3645 GN=DSM3645_21574 PE=4 SV=1: FAD_binding_2: Succ_DH_flav_C [Tuwongella immobilis]